MSRASQTNNLKQNDKNLQLQRHNQPPNHVHRTSCGPHQPTQIPILVCPDYRDYLVCPNKNIRQGI